MKIAAKHADFAPCWGRLFVLAFGQRSIPCAPIPFVVIFIAFSKWGVKVGHQAFASE